MDAEIPRQLMARLGPLGRLVPYRLFIISTDQYVTLVIHEQFHAFQAESSPRRFEAAGAAYGPGAAYPWEQDGYRAAWRDEVTLLQDALRPDWKRGFAQSDRHLDELLAEAVAGPSPIERR